MESGNFTGWTGTWEDTDSQCNGGTLLGLCLGTSGPNPFHYNGLNQGAVNQAANALPEKNHFIMTGGNDPIAGAAIPVVYPGGGTYSMRLGNAQAEDGGESVSYSFLVTSSNVNFTYHYAVVLGGGSHSAGDQAFFQIRMTDGSGNPIACATYDVDATTSASIGGFVNVGGNMYKPWTSVFIPLYNYIGQTVTIQFITRDCFAGGGSHFAYAYLDATCAPLEIISSSPTVCGGQTETLTAPAGAATYTWSGPGIVAPTGDQQIASINLAGAYSVTMTTLGNSPCSFTLDTVIDPAASNPTANFTYAPVCVGNPVQFTDVSTPTGGIANWAWDFNADGNPDATTQNPSHTFPSSGTYPVRLLVVATPCADDTIINVDVLSTPTSTFTVTTPHCVGENSTITYTGNAPANAAYAWSFDGGTVVSGTGQGPYQISWATGGSKNVSLTVSLGSCSSPQTANSVVINALPTVSAGADVFICTGESTTLTATGATTYDWAPATGLSATTGASVTATPATTTTYTITGTSNGCVGTGTVTVNVNPFPVVGVNPTTATVCAGTSTTFTANGATTYAWSPATGLSATTGTSVDATPLTTTTYTVTGTTNGCSADATFDITVNTSPTVIVSPAVALCGGQTTTLLANGATTYAWSPAVGLSATTGGSVDATPLVTTTYTVVGTALGCTNTQTIDITVTPYPIVSISPSASAICEGDSKGFTASGATTYLWSPATGLSTTTGTTVTADPVVTTSYQVIGSTNGCNDTATAVLTVNPIPVTTISPDVTICSGQTTPLVAGGATTYSWTPTTGLSAATGANVIANPMVTTTYTVTGTSLLCTSAATMTVTVNQTPTVSVSPAQFAFCDGGSTLLTAAGATSYVWSPATGLNQTAGTYVTANPTATTTYTVVGSTLGCIDNAVSTITVYPNPVVDFTVDEPTGCVPHCVVFGNASTIATGSNTYTWDFGNGETANGMNQAYCYADSGTYTVTLTATSNNNCVSTLEKIDYISAYPNPIARFTVDPKSASVLNPKFQFTDNSSGATEWYWSFGDGTTVQNLVTTPAHVYPTNIDSGTYTVNLEVINQYGCVDETTLDVYITPHISLYIPNAFSPNEDNHNNTFRAYGENIERFEMWIYNRWGQEIFYTAVMEKGWDGTYKGKQVENDVYVYRIIYRDIEGTEGNPSGSVTLFR
jgi:gliding motility-associated-like protein